MSHTLIGHISDRTGGAGPKQQFIHPARLTATTEETWQVFSGFNRTCLKPNPTRSRRLAQLNLRKDRNVCSKWLLSGNVFHVLKFILRGSVSSVRLCELMYHEISASS